MNRFKLNLLRRAAHVVWYGVAVLLLSGWLAIPAFAQKSDSNAKNALTTENLIGGAVSMSNRSYPEVDKAIQRFRNGDVKGAIEFLEQAKKKYSKLPPTDVTMAKMQLAARNAQAVRFLLERAVKDHPDDPEAYLLLADQAYISGRTTEAQALFELAAPLVEKFDENKKRKQDFSVRVIAGRGAVAERRQQWDQAYQLLKKWIEVDPESAAAHQRIGIVLFRLDKSREALEQFTKAQKLNPEVGHPFIVLGQLFSKNGEKEKAKKSFEKAYRDNKNNSRVAQAYAEWLIQEGQLDKAQSVAATLRKQSPNDTVALLLDGIVAHMQNDTERAEQALTKVLSIDPSNATATNLLALLLIESDSNADKERALRYAQVNAERFESSVQANVTLGWVLYRLGRANEANAALQKGAQSGKLQADSAYLIAKIMSDQGKKVQAVQTLEQVLKQKSGIFLFRRDAEKLLNELQEEN